MKSSPTFILLFLLTLMSASLTSCFEEDVKAGGPGSPGSSLPTSPPEAGISITSDVTVDYPNHVSQLVGGVHIPNSKCEVTGMAGTTSCVADVPEEHLFFSGYKWRFKVQSTQCRYLFMTPDYYYKAEPGWGPTAVSYNVDAAGIIDPLSVLPAGAGLAVVNNTVRCRYDYSDKFSFAMPNCCEGTFTKTVQPPAPAAAIVTSNVSWGGKHGDCLAGPAIKSQQLTTSGYPRTSFWTVPTDRALDVTYTITPPNDLTTTIAENYHAANFYPNPDISAPPVSTTPQATNPVGPPGVRPAATVPYLVLACTNGYGEVKATFHLFIREWNLMSEFDQWPAGNPDSTGVAPPPFSGPANDFFDRMDLNTFDQGLGLGINPSFGFGLGYPGG